jgi:hypothetical protein
MLVSTLIAPRQTPPLGASRVRRSLKSVKTATFFAIALSLHGQDPRLEHARSVNLARAASLPNFVADEIAVRYKSRGGDPPQWQRVDTIESEISAVRESDFTRQHIRVNGKPWNKPDIPDGVKWDARLGAELMPLFSPDCHTVIEYAGSRQAGGKTGFDYNFHSAADGCFPNIGIKNGLLSPLKIYNPARKGKFVIDDPQGNLILFDIETSDFPKGFAVLPTREITTWDYVKIGDASFLLPVSYELFGGPKHDGPWHVTVEYRNHRHFESSSNLTFK